MQYYLRAALFMAYSTLYGTARESHVRAVTKYLPDPSTFETGLLLSVAIVVGTIYIFYAVHRSSGRRDDIIDQTNDPVRNTTFGA
jgi:hypothetical protein